MLNNEFKNSISKQTNKRSKLVKNFMWVTKIKKSIVSTENHSLPPSSRYSPQIAFLNVPQHVYNELIKLNGIGFQNHCIRIEEERTTKQTQGEPLNKQNRPNPTIMPGEKSCFETVLTASP